MLSLLYNCKDVIKSSCASFCTFYAYFKYFLVAKILWPILYICTDYDHDCDNFYFSTSNEDTKSPLFFKKTITCSFYTRVLTLCDKVFLIKHRLLFNTSI